jgi:hypothetical protein
MPEIKNTFTQGKMNKDLDERLVPNGQYRDGLNIQVSTSEGSDVGTVQNILGNLNVFSYVPFYGPGGPDASISTDNGNQIDPTAKCIGAIADEKNNCFYWFVYSSTKSVILKYVSDGLGQIGFVFVDTTNDVLEFSNNLITGINIIDDYLFWTDGLNEPKKIDIQQCILGTNQGGHYDTRLMIPKRGIDYNSNIPFKKENITVIKPNPTTKLIVDPIFAISTTAITEFDFANIEEQDTVTIQFDNFLPTNTSYSEGDTIKLLDTASAGNVDENYQVRLLITQNVSTSSAINTYECRVLSKSSSTPAVINTFNCLKQVDSKIFPRKFIRFGYRYRYNSGEYSAFSPFTDPVFKSGEFDYSPKKAYNKAMENNLISVKLRNIIPSNIPNDVVQVDILYTEDNSPTVYIVDKIKFYDYENITLGLLASDRIQVNNWVANLYEVTADLIYTAVPANQLTRHYDSVPITALAQEVTGSRIVYGNYEQNYDVSTKPVLRAGYSSRYINNITYNYDYIGNYTSSVQPIKTSINVREGNKSLKSMRDYQLGVSYLDKYGRQTPIFTSNDSQFKVPKKHAAYKSKINGRIITSPPAWADSFKIYVKETSTEYYNVALSRVYRASDGDIWLAFPSSERNKIDEDTFLILKKSSDSDSLVTEEAKYKVLAIENEAPDYVRERISPVVSLGCGAGTVTNDADTLFGAAAPTEGSRFFDIDKTTYNTSNAPSLTELQGNLYVQFFNDVPSGDDNYSNRYEIASVIENSGVFNITLKDTIDGSDASFLYVNYPTTDDASVGTLNIRSTMKVVFYEGIVKSLPEFKGVFFVKINADTVAQTEIISALNTAVDYEVTKTLHTFHFCDDIGHPGSGNTTTSNTSSNSVNNLHNILGGSNAPTFGTTDSYDEWESLLTFGSNTSGSFLDKIHDGTPGTHGGFFIDRAFYAGVHTQGSIEGNDEDDNSDTMNPNHLINEALQPSVFVNDPDAPQSHGWLDYDNVEPVLGATTAYGKGIYEENGNWYLELSFSGVGLDISTSDIPIDIVSGELQFHIWLFNQASNWEVVNNDHNQFDAIYNTKLIQLVNKISENEIFKFKGDQSDTKFQIKSVEKVKRYNVISPRHIFTNAVDFQVGWIASYNNAYDAWQNDFLDFKTNLQKFSNPSNRRLTYRINLGNQDPSSILIDVSGTPTAILDAADTDTPIAIQFLDTKIPDDDPDVLSDNPAIFETEPKETADLDFYYEATEALPLNINKQNAETFIPLGSVITCPGRPDVVATNQPPPAPANITDYVTNIDGTLVTCVHGISLDHLIYIQGVPAFGTHTTEAPLYFTRPDDSYTTAYVDITLTGTAQSSGAISSNQFYIRSGVARNPFALSWFNCFSFKNGVESNRIRDDFNAVTLDKGVKVSSTVDFTYEREKRKSGLIFSGIYNSNTGINDLNQFILSENITKDLNPTYGSIQKLFQRESDLIAFCEDRVVAILANKDTLFNADGSANVVATTNVLGNANPFSGDYGISKNPESFAKDNYRAYFTDKQRGAVLRLSMDGLTPISEYGMSDYFKDAFKTETIFIGSYDVKKDQYNITMPFSNTTISYKENVKGWPSFKSFVPEQGLSLSGNYYTFKNGIPHQHHNKTVNRNTFYGDYYSSSIDLLLNENPSIIKTFKTVKYEGSQSKVNQEVSRVETGYYNLQDLDGWYADLVLTDKGTPNEQRGSVSEFIEKEGKWFNNIKGNENDRKTDEFSFQGIGKAEDIIVDPALFPAVMGCTNPAATNYNPLATIDNGSCTFTPSPSATHIGGCMDPLATNYDATATFDDGTCEYTPPQTVYGCTNPVSTNYNPNATVDDGSCIPIIYGCTDPSAINYFAGANTDDGSCLYQMVPGCTDPQAINFDPLATVDDGTCIYINQPVQGCTDPLATNYDPLATQDDGSCVYPPVLGCTDPLANNYDPLATQDDGSCTYNPTTPFSFRDNNDDD